MNTIQVAGQTTVDDLLKVVGQLNLTELEKFVSHVLHLQAQRRAISLPNEQAKLLLKINRKFPINWDMRYKALQTKLLAESLTLKEEAELVDLITKREKWQAQRLEALAKLATLRNTTLRGVMNQLGIESPGYV